MNLRKSRAQYVCTVNPLRRPLTISTPQRAGTTQDSQSATDRETEAKLEEISKMYEQNKDSVVKKLLDRVVLVQPELHRNLRKVERA